jgi:hypothetical protein
MNEKTFRDEYSLSQEMYADLSSWSCHEEWYSPVGPLRETQ